MPTSTEHNKWIVQQYVEGFNRGDMEALPKLFTSDVQIQGVLGFGGLDVAIPVWTELHSAFGIQLDIVAMIAERDVVAVRYTERGTFRAAFRGKEPTGKSYELVAMEWFEFKEGLIHRRWGARDSASQARQLEM